MFLSRSAFRQVVQRKYLRNCIVVVLVFRSAIFVGIITREQYANFSAQINSACPRNPQTSCTNFYQLAKNYSVLPSTKVLLKNAIKEFTYLTYLPLTVNAYYELLSGTQPTVSRTSVYWDAPMFGQRERIIFFFIPHISSEDFHFVFENRPISEEEFNIFEKSSRSYGQIGWNDGEYTVANVPELYYNIADRTTKLRTLYLLFPQALISGKLPVALFKELHANFVNYIVKEDRNLPVASNGFYTFDHHFCGSKKYENDICSSLAATLTGYDYTCQKVLLTQSPIWDNIKRNGKVIPNGITFNLGNTTVYNFKNCSEAIVKSVFSVSAVLILNLVVLIILFFIAGVV